MSISSIPHAEYPCTSIDWDECVQFTHMKLQNDDDVRIIFFVIGQYSSKGLVELDATLTRFVHAIWESLIGPILVKISGCAWSEEISLIYPWFCLCLIMLLKLLLLLCFAVKICWLFSWCGWIMLLLLLGLNVI